MQKIIMRQPQYIKKNLLITAGKIMKFRITGQTSHNKVSLT
jgi:hypothetical protein